MDIRSTIFKLSSPPPDMLRSHYVIAQQLYQLVVNFKWKEMLHHKANHTTNFFHGTKFPMLLSQHINLSAGKQLTEQLSHHLLHVSPCTAAAFY
jgi:hypothetical protein